MVAILQILHRDEPFARLLGGDYFPTQKNALSTGVSRPGSRCRHHAKPALIVVFAVETNCPKPTIRQSRMSPGIRLIRNSNAEG
jgi:hypothetical protein